MERPAAARPRRAAAASRARAARPAPRPPPPPAPAPATSWTPAATAPWTPPSRRSSPGRSAKGGSTYIPPAPGASSKPEKLGQGDIMAVVVGQKAAIKSCVSRYKYSGGGSGTLVMRWTILPTGRTQNVAPKGPDHAVLAGCIGKLIQRLALSRVRRRHHVAHRVPLHVLRRDPALPLSTAAARRSGWPDAWPRANQGACTGRIASGGLACRFAPGARAAAGAGRLHVGGARPTVRERRGLRERKPMPSQREDLRAGLPGRRRLPHRRDVRRLGRAPAIRRAPDVRTASSATRTTASAWGGLQ